MTITTHEQIEKLRAAIATEKENRVKAEAHARELSILQKREAKLKKTLERVQAYIVANIQITFDVSDDMTIAAAEEALVKLIEKENANN